MPWWPSPGTAADGCRGPMQSNLWLLQPNTQRQSNLPFHPLAAQFTRQITHGIHVIWSRFPFTPPVNHGLALPPSVGTSASRSISTLLPFFSSLFSSTSPPPALFAVWSVALCSFSLLDRIFPQIHWSHEQSLVDWLSVPQSQHITSKGRLKQYRPSDQLASLLSITLFCLSIALLLPPLQTLAVFSPLAYLLAHAKSSQTSLAQPLSARFSARFIHRISRLHLQAVVRSHRVHDHKSRQYVSVFRSPHPPLRPFLSRPHLTTPGLLACVACKSC